MRKSLHVLSVVAASAALLVFATPAEADGGLQMGEWACHTPGNETPLMAMAFKVTGPNTYSDLDNTTRGTFEVRGNKTIFHGGHLDGETAIGPDQGLLGFSGGTIVCRHW